jgi:arginyl-tRNA synthetase
MLCIYIGIEPIAVSLSDNVKTALITRCSNIQFGDFQCNNTMSISKELKSMESYHGIIYTLQ